MPVGSPAYNAALEAITQQVVVANAGGGKANGSALNQIRVNEHRLDDTGDGLDWEVPLKWRVFLHVGHLRCGHFWAKAPASDAAAGAPPVAARPSSAA